MKRGRKKHQLCRVGDHQFHGQRDVHPGRTPVTFFWEDGKIWHVADLPDHMVAAVRKLARKEKLDLDLFLSALFVDQIQKRLDEAERGF